MNAPVSDDYYEYLQVSSNADQETIERVYRLLAKKYHPDNQNTGNIDKFNILTKAYETLTDPVKRAAYDILHGQAKHREWKAFSEMAAFDGLGNDSQIRRAILSILYIRRRDTPETPGVGNWELEKVVGLPEKIIAFHIWYLKEKKWIATIDTGGYAISAAGVDVIEEDGVVLGKDLLLNDGTAENRRPMIEEETPSRVSTYETAIASLKAKVALNPDNMAAWVGITYFCNKLGREEDAVAAARKILQIDPTFTTENFENILALKFRVDGMRNASLLLKAGLRESRRMPNDQNHLQI
jgi:tetratricopeptide (TPR) repeat protein